MCSQLSLGLKRKHGSHKVFWASRGRLASAEKTSSKSTRVGVMVLEFSWDTSVPCMQLTALKKHCLPGRQRWTAATAGRGPRCLVLWSMWGFSFPLTGLGSTIVNFPWRISCSRPSQPVQCGSFTLYRFLDKTNLYYFHLKCDTSFTFCYQA